VPAGLVPVTTAPEAAPAQTRPPDRRVPTRVQQQYLGPGLSQRRCLPQRMGLRQPHLITAVLPGAGGEGGGQAPGGQLPQVDAAFETGARVPPGPNARLPITLPALGTGSVPVSRLAATSHT
jgi:hypothetical protein